MLGDQVLDRRAIADIATMRRRDTLELVDQALQLEGVDIGQHHRGTQLRAESGGRRADSACGAGDQDARA